MLKRKVLGNVKARVVPLGVVFLLVFAGVSGLFFVFTPSVSASFSGSGSGTVGDPYNITSWGELSEVNSFLSSHFVLRNNLDSSSAGYDTYASSTANFGAGWLPIGTGLGADAFNGDFNGNNYTISDLYVNRPSTDFVGLFGSVVGASSVRYLNIVDVDVTGAERVGGFSGYIRDVDVSFVTVSGSVTGTAYVGGFGGRIEGSSVVSSCYSTGSVTGTNYVGGFGGNIEGSSIFSSCYSTGNVTGNNLVGGFGGRISGSSVVSSCYSTGSVTGNNSVGGFVGYISGSSVVSSCYSTGSVTGNNYVGGFGGNIEGSSVVSSCYSTGSVTGTNYVGGFGGRISGSSVVSSCYSTGSVTRSSGTDIRFGGFVGFNFQSNITNCYSIGSVHYTGASDPTNKGFAGSVNTGGGYVDVGNFFDNVTSGQLTTSGNALGRNTSTLQMMSTFVTAGWDIEHMYSYDAGDIAPWYIRDGFSYPKTDLVRPFGDYVLRGLRTRSQSPNYLYWTDVAGSTVTSQTMYIDTNLSMLNENCTDINIRITDIDSDLDVTSFSLQVINSTDGTWAGATAESFPASGVLVINSSNWAGAWFDGTNPFPIHNKSVTIEIRISVSIPVGKAHGLYQAFDWNVEWRVK